MPLGYQIFVGIDGMTCTYQVQDMIMKRAQLAEWMKDMPDKDRQIDIVPDGKAPRQCFHQGWAVSKKAGFPHTLIIDGRRRHYGGSSYFRD